MLEYIVGGVVGVGVILKALTSERVLEYLCNKVKSARYSVINDIPKELSSEYEKTSKAEAEKANEIYNFFRLGLIS